MDFSPTLIGCRTASERSRLPDVHGRMPRACHFSAARQLDHAACGRKTRFSATLHPASAARVPQDRSWPGRPRGQHGSPFSCLGPAGLRRRPHAFHTGARRWNRGHGRDLAKSQRNRSRTASAHRDRKKNPKLRSRIEIGREIQKSQLLLVQLYQICPGFPEVVFCLMHGQGGGRGA